MTRAPIAPPPLTAPGGLVTPAAPNAVTARLPAAAPILTLWPLPVSGGYVGHLRKVTLATRAAESQQRERAFTLGHRSLAVRTAAQPEGPQNGLRPRRGPSAVLRPARCGG